MFLLLINLLLATPEYYTKKCSQKHAVFEAAQSAALTTFIFLSPWRPLKKQHCQEQSCLGQHSSCQLCLCTLWKGRRYHKRAGGAWLVCILFFSLALTTCQFLLVFAVLFGLVELIIWELSVQLL